MKTFLLISALIILTGCTKEDSKISPPSSEPSQKSEMKYGVNLDEFPDKKGNDYALEFDWQYDLAEKYGRTFYKANKICRNKFSYILDKATDTSTEEGSLTINEFNKSYELCVRESLASQPIIPEKDRMKLVRVQSGSNQIESDTTSNNSQSNSNSLKNMPSENTASKNYTYDANGWRYDDISHKWVNAKSDGRTDVSVTYNDGKVKPAAQESSEKRQVSKEEELQDVQKTLDKGTAPIEIKIIVYCTRKSEIYYKNDLDMQKIKFSECVNELNNNK